MLNLADQLMRSSGYGMNRMGGLIQAVFLTVTKMTPLSGARSTQAGVGPHDVESTHSLRSDTAP
jgi:hypothetical protein